MPGFSSSPRNAPPGPCRHLLALLLLLGAEQVFANTPTVDIEGGDEALRENVRAHLAVDRESCELQAWRERTIIRGARRDARRALEAMGYYHPDIEIAVRRDSECWRLEVRMEPGMPVRIREKDIRLEGEASEDPTFQALLAASPVQQGAVARHDHYEQLKNRLVRLAAERGYFDSELTRARLDINPAERIADVHLTLDSGPRYRFGETVFEQDFLDEDLVQRFVPFQSGEPFDNSKLLGLRQELNRSGYFREIRIRTRQDQATPDNLRVPVQVTAAPRPRYAFMAGAGYATDTGPRLRLGLENRRVNRRGHSYQAEVEASEITTGAGFNYRIPRKQPNREYLNLFTSYLRDETDTSLSERYRLGAALVDELDSGWVMTRSLEFEREFFTITDQQDRADLVMPGLELSRTRADDPVYPRLGWHLNGKVRVASETALSTVSFTQLRGRGKVVLPLLGGRVLSRLEAGTTLVDETVELPASVRFFAGGDNSVRGYGYEELGPENAEGDVVGGRHLLTGSVEYDHPVFKRWSLAVFMDAGNAFDSFDDYEIFRGIGAGVRWRSPIGPIRLDIARPQDERETFRLHISMGPDL